MTDRRNLIPFFSEIIISILFIYTDCCMMHFPYSNGVIYSKKVLGTHKINSSSITVYKNFLYSLCYPCLSHTGRKQRFVPDRIIRRPTDLDQIVFCLDLPFILFQFLFFSLVLWHMFKKVNSLYFQPAKIILL